MTTIDISYRAVTVLGLFSTTRARKAVAVLRKAGENEYSMSIINELVQAGAIRRTTPGWYIRAA